MDEGRIIYDTEDGQPNFILMNDEKNEEEPVRQEQYDYGFRGPEATVAQPAKPPKKKGRFKKFVAVVLIVILSGSAGFIGGVAAVEYRDSSNVPSGIG
ncbi:MAG: hypothetical protein WC977_08705, partial [Anaerovoracaceae bacterium]